MTWERERRLFSDRFVTHAISVHPDCAAEDETAHTCVAGGFEQDLRSTDVDTTGSHRVGHDVVDVCDRSEMDHCLAAKKGGADRSAVKDVPELGFDHVAVVGRMHQIEDPGLMARFE